MNQKHIDLFIINSVAALLLLPYLGAVHLFDWDEINFAECAREMIATGNYFRVHINYLPFWEKPPLFFWLQAAAMHLFGINEFAARLPNAICGLATLSALYLIGLRHHGMAFGRLWALIYAGSVLPQFYFHSGIIDPWLNLFTFLGIYSFYRFQREATPSVKWIWLSGLFTGLALITKGPVAIIIFSLTFFIHWALLRFKLYFTISQVLVFVISVATVSLLWYGYEVYTNGLWFLTEFITYNYRLFSTPDAGHGGFPGYHVVVLLIGCFPASFFYLNYLLKYKKYYDESGFAVWMLILFFVVLILFSIVKSKIVHYSSMCYFPLTYGAALMLHTHIKAKSSFNSVLRTSIAIFLIVVGIVVAAFPFLVQQKTLLVKLLSKDAFAVANLQADVRWSGLEWTVGLLAVGIAAWWLYYVRSQLLWAVNGLYAGMAIWIVLALYAFIGRVEQFTQNANIEFFKKIAHEDAYVVTVGYRSYAHYFYGRVREINSPKGYPLPEGDTWGHAWRHSLLYEKNDKPVYISAKITARDELMQIPHIEILYEKNGWIFARKPITSHKN